MKDERIVFDLSKNEALWILEELTSAREFMDGGGDTEKLSEIIGIIRYQINRNSASN